MKRDPRFNPGDLLRCYGYNAIIGRVDKVEWSGTYGSPAYLILREVPADCSHEPKNSFCNCSHKSLYVCEGGDTECLHLVECDNCGSEDIGSECGSLDKRYFCCEECLDSYLEGGKGILSANPQDKSIPAHDGKAFTVKRDKEQANP